MFRRMTLLSLSLLLICAVAAVGQVPGTLWGQVFDENGDGVPEVKITITDPEAANFRQEGTTDKRGKFSIRVNNSVPLYDFKLEKEGFQSMIIPAIKVPGRTRTRRDFDLTSAAAALAARDPEEIEKGNYVKLYNQGVSALEAQSFGLAKSLFEGAIEKKADYGPAHGGLARVYWKQEDWENALSSAQRSVELNPDDTEIQQVLYAAYNGLGQTDKAKTILTEMQASDPAKAGLNMFQRGRRSLQQRPAGRSEGNVRADPRRSAGPRQDPLHARSLLRQRRSERASEGALEPVSRARSQRS